MKKDNNMTFLCGLCNEVFAIPARRGRPPSYCKDCETKAPTVADRKRILAQARVDRLISTLESHGMALSQNNNEE